MNARIAMLATALGLCVCGTAAAQQQDLRSPDQVSPALVATQDLRSPDQVSPAPVATQDLRSPDQVSPAAVATQDLRSPDQVSPVSVVVATPAASQGGLSALWIVLISVSGALALSAIGFAATRVVQGRQRPAA